MELQTNRIILKLLTPSIIKNLFLNNSKETIKEYLGVDEEGYHRYQDMLIKGMETNRISFRYFIVVDKITNTAMGECGFHTWNHAHRRAELFYFLHKDEFKNQGFISEVLPVVLNFGFKEMHLHRIEALIAGDNIPSKRLLEKNHFTKEGVVREDYVVNGISEDSICYSLLKPEWEKFRD